MLVGVLPCASPPPLPSPPQLDLYKKRKVWWKVERLREMGLEAKQEEKAAITELRNAEAADKPLQVLLSVASNFCSYPPCLGARQTFEKQIVNISCRRAVS